MKPALVGSILLFVVLTSLLLLAGLVFPQSPLGQVSHQLRGQLVAGEIVCLVLLFFLAGENEQLN